ncbi:B2 protein-like isoform X1 [Telopea speciosissima]|uniref:B2 protein-like isoform X1 n=1 Tax=Telopea speciosissima TaxID=54955 RepID=UPI001CC5EA28|nr:B2 protein-like isoform X1 [Telopea speciosissima]XP_043698336.1 B2 protein-like isoform X1 [Telopea speciosissima]
MENSQQSFWQFSDQLRLQSTNLANLSINDSIWGNSFTTKRPEERKNFDIRVGGDRVSSINNNLKPNGSNLNGFNDDWKTGRGSNFNGFNNGWKIGNGLDGVLGGGGVPKNVGVNGIFDKGIYPKQPILDGKNNSNNSKFNINPNNNSSNKGKGNKDEDHEGNKGGKKSNNNNNNSSSSKNSADKRFKTLPASEALPRDETIGGYIFVCNNETMQENLQRLLFGLPPRYRDSVRAITPGLPLFLYNYSTHQLHGIFSAASFGGTNIDPTAWEDKKCPGESRFPAQVRVVAKKNCEPLEEDAFRPILHHYDGPKFRLELNIPEALALLDIFAESNP